ncbi:MAG: hypothetical protein A2015_00095 [Spirochaetes bacterium GWF1_31_7]|nr:MAG: hypothetical protein A2Y30_00270 [Spirochaetes bacterium GWE1_32_154]OHD50987.1 MAG: hypothetical protein A2Y29_10595 [Spirochaetes bacterium GWE2_31_10]OHD51641.1 MAG: hypothetical protein A2015_00095 [Spirochaetes bacterium GWF1_31_7]HBD94986.1 hypothetical protein [Spirochaetia bacterium]HBI36706.1 hypothetical protein [Spirochaetia bacterium]
MISTFKTIVLFIDSNLFDFISIILVLLLILEIIACKGKIFKDSWLFRIFFGLLGYVTLYLIIRGCSIVF